MLTEESLTADGARTLVGADSRAPISVTFVRPHNHTWKVAGPGRSWFVKAHSKPWYSGADDAAGAVRHEAAAHRMLKDRGLSNVVVAAAITTTASPLGWPCLVTEELSGSSLPDALVDAADGERDAALRTVGRHLAQVHAVRFDHAGYLTAGPPVSDPDPRGWQHPIWAHAPFLAGAAATWSTDRLTVPERTMRRVDALFDQAHTTVERSFRPPRFTHGDCNANAVYVERSEDGWSVTGLLDLEVASAANPAFDLNKLFLELTGVFRRSSYDWWTPFFDGYGDEPDFDATRLLLAAAGEENYTCLGDRSWGLSRSGVLEHIVSAANWGELFRPGA